MTVRIFRPVLREKTLLIRAWREKDAEPLYVLSAELREGSKVVARAEGKVVNKNYGKKT